MKGITVRELIAKLNNMPLDDEVWVFSGKLHTQPITSADGVHMAHDLSCVIIEV